MNSVLEGWLAKQKEQFPDTDGPWLVGNKLSYADIAFISWQNIIQLVIVKDQFDIDEYPLVKEWVAKMTARPAVKKVLEGAIAHSKSQQ